MRRSNKKSSTKKTNTNCLIKSSIHHNTTTKVYLEIYKLAMYFYKDVKLLQKTVCTSLTYSLTQGCNSYSVFYSRTPLSNSNCDTINITFSLWPSFSFSPFFPYSCLSFSFSVIWSLFSLSVGLSVSLVFLFYCFFFI